MMEPLGWVTLGGYFVLMIAIGFYAWRKANADAEGYMLGGRDLGPGVTALSAGASDMSGWLLMGLPGAVLIGGLSQAWIAIGLIIGAWANYHLVAPRLRTFTEIANDAITIPDFLAERFGGRATCCASPPPWSSSCSSLSIAARAWLRRANLRSARLASAISTG